MRIAVVGAGGVGGYFGGRLAQAGEEVIFIARGSHLQALQTEGLRVESLYGDFVIQPVQAAADPATVGAVDAILLAVKTWQVREAAQTLQPMIGPQTFVVPLQNGVETPQLLTEMVGPQHTIGGLCGLISYIAGPGHVRHAGGEPFITFGELDNHPSDRVERLYQAFTRTIGVKATIPPDIQVAVWSKFLLIAAWSGVGSITRSPIGVILAVPETRQMLVQAMQEIFEVGRAHGVALEPEVFDRTMAFFEGLPPQGTASMQRDVMAGRLSELEAQNGAVVRLGQAVEVETPLHSFIYHSLLPLELRARGQVEFAGG
jgi:2-dehydropantoate 2-reductase